MTRPGPVAPRGPSVSEILTIRWEYPTYVIESAPVKSGTTVKEMRSALTREEALAQIAGTDRRPLLVLRECARCNKTDDALLQPGVDNEKVAFLSRWFRCVRLPIDVVQPDHPFHALFPGDDSEHLFVVAFDGANQQALESDTSRTQLCSAMSSVLAASYVKDPTALYKDLHVFGDQLDGLDQEVRELEKKRSAEMESRTLDKKRLAKIERDLAAVKKKIDAKIADIAKVSEIELKPEPGTEKRNG